MFPPRTPPFPRASASDMNLNRLPTNGVLRLHPLPPVPTLPSFEWNNTSIRLIWPASINPPTALSLELLDSLGLIRLFLPLA